MMSSKKKRKRRSQDYSDFVPSEPKLQDDNLEFLGHHKHLVTTSSFGSDEHTSSPKGKDLFQTLSIRAYEADLVRGASAELSSAALEVVKCVPDSTMPGGWKVTPATGSALIEVGGSNSYAEELDDSAPAGISSRSLAQPRVLVDRYDARLLLESLPVFVKPPQRPPDSPTGWSDLPSDSEDTFFLDPEEIADFRREQRRREIEKAREERLRARMQEDDDDVIRLEEDVWGGSDEEPEDTCKDLMQRTANHLVDSPNAAQLEMRILANHGSDKRFSFLRGRWSRAWNLTKAKARLEKEKEKSKQATGAAIGSLAGYGSDSDEDECEVSADQQPTASPAIISGGNLETDLTGQAAEVDEEMLREARRKRLKEWREKRQKEN